MIDARGLGKYVRAVNETEGVGLDIEAVKEPLSDLAKEIKRHIMIQGPISIHEYMVLTTNHSRLGYYHQNRDQIGTDGDFITSPEISQIFGEMIAVWCISVWEKMGSPEKVNLVEMGPGRGTLMKDLLRTLSRFPRLKNIFKISLIELSDHMKKIQGENLSQGDFEEIPIDWYSSLDEISAEIPILFIGQEVLDTFPIRQFQYTEKGWTEIMVDIDPTSETSNHFRFVLSSEAAESMVIFKGSGHTSLDSKEQLESKIGDRIEYNPLALSTVEKVSKLIKASKGAALFFDYGERYCQKDTLRGFRKHKEAHVLSEPGLVDITADVDFLACENIAKKNGVNVEKTVTQGDFLIGMGAVSRIEQLINDDNTTDEQATLLVESFKKIVHPDEMGKRFKVLGLSNLGGGSREGQIEVGEGKKGSLVDAHSNNLPGF